MIDVDAESACRLFGLGTPIAAPRRSRAGWGGHNVMWKIVTDTGNYALKQVGRELPPTTAITTALAVEVQACDKGISAPRPLLSIHENCYEVVGDSPLRCHEWAEGSAKSNEGATAADAERMGSLVAQLHGLTIAVDEPVAPSARDEGDDWLSLAAEGATRAAPWASVIRENLPALRRAAGLAAAAGDLEHRIGSHRDLNAHNVLFDCDRLVLVDWDAAGPASARAERAEYSVLWAYTADGTYDADTAIAFLRGYRAAGGTVDRDDPASLPGWLRGVIWWAQQNVRMAAERSTDAQDDLATMLVEAVIAGPTTVAVRQAFLAECIARL